MCIYSQGNVRLVTANVVGVTSFAQIPQLDFRGHFEVGERKGKGKEEKRKGTEGKRRKGRKKAPRRQMCFWLRLCLMRITTAEADNDCLKLHNSQKRRIVCISKSRSSSSSSEFVPLSRSV